MKISVITVNYNDAVGLERTVKSVISQIFVPKEYIIVDGGSIDGSLGIIEKYSSFISKWISEQDSGIYNAMNKGICMATGDYCIMLNSGDVFYSSNVLNDVVMHLKSGVDIYNGNAIYIKDGKIEWYRKGHKDISLQHFLRSSICHQSSFVKTSLLKKYMFDESYRMVSDWKFWLQSICIDHASYKAINVDVCCFDMGGVTYRQKSLGDSERESIIKSLFPADKVAEIQEKRGEKSIFQYIYEGAERKFWLYYARLFMSKKIKNVL